MNIRQATGRARRQPQVSVVVLSQSGCLLWGLSELSISVHFRRPHTRRGGDVHSRRRIRANSRGRGGANGPTLAHIEGPGCTAAVTLVTQSQLREEINFSGSNNSLECNELVVPVAVVLLLVVLVVVVVLSFPPPGTSTGRTQCRIDVLGARQDRARWTRMMMMTGTTSAPDGRHDDNGGLSGGACYVIVLLGNSISTSGREQTLFGSFGGERGAQKAPTGRPSSSSSSSPPPLPSPLPTTTSKGWGHFRASFQPQPGRADDDGRQMKRDIDYVGSFLPPSMAAQIDSMLGLLVDCFWRPARPQPGRH